MTVGNTTSRIYFASNIVNKSSGNLKDAGNINVPYCPSKLVNSNNNQIAFKGGATMAEPVTGSLMLLGAAIFRTIAAFTGGVVSVAGMTIRGACNGVAKLSDKVLVNGGRQLTGKALGETLGQYLNVPINFKKL